MIIVSGCLLGINCKYSGGNNRNEELIEYLGDREYKVICPEQYGGLTTPRVPSEISGGDGFDVLDGKARVYAKDGKDVTDEFINGAEKALEICIENKADIAILKEKSPSCGSEFVYDGSFTGKKIRGCGVAAALFKRNNIDIFNEKNFKDIK